MLAWVPNKDNGTATITVDYHYYTSLRKKKYYQHHDGVDNAKAAVEKFLARHPKCLSHDLRHDQDRQCFILSIVEAYHAPKSPTS